MNNKRIYRALALDLDGTLTDSNKKLPAANKAAVIKAIDRGCAVMLASGRPVPGIARLADELELDRRGGYVLACNGANIIDWRSKELIYEKLLPRECIHEICVQARENGAVALTYKDDVIVTENNTDEYVIKEIKCNNIAAVRVEDLESFVSYPVSKFLVVGEHEKLLAVQKLLLEKHCDMLDAFFSESYFLEVVPKGITKAAAADKLLSKLGIDRSELMAVGDGENDIPLLKYSGFAVAMENAYPEVKKYADYMTKSNDECGVAYVINKFLL